MTTTNWFNNIVDKVAGPGQGRKWTFYISFRFPRTTLLDYFSLLQNISDLKNIFRKNKDLSSGATLHFSSICTVELWNRLTAAHLCYSLKIIRHSKDSCLLEVPLGVPSLFSYSILVLLCPMQNITVPGGLWAVSVDCLTGSFLFHLNSSAKTVVSVIQYTCGSSLWGEAAAFPKVP